MATSARRQDDDTQKAQGQGRVAAGGYDDQGHPLTREGHVDHRVERGEMNDDSDDSNTSANRKSSDSAAKSQASDHDAQGRKLTKDGHVDKRTERGHTNDDDDDDMVESRGGARKSTTNRHTADHESSSQGHVAAGGYDDEGHPLTKDGHVDKRVKAAQD
jgi:hypothetical protein